MKTIVTRMKTLVNNNRGEGGTLSYVKHVEIVHPQIALLNISKSLLPSILITPINTNEMWDATQRRIEEHSVRAYLMMMYNQRELSIIGDAARVQGKGILDFENDFASVFRGHRLAVDGTNYLAKPLDFSNIDYFDDNLSEDVFLLVAEITMLCTRIRMQTALPGNI